jgi:tetrahydromethanopterin S-methyltransferase F subunit
MQLISRNQKLTSAVGATKVLGLVLGAVFIFALVLIPVLLLGGI